MVSNYVQNRFRRLRQNPAMRRMVRENNVSRDDLILPIFVEENITERQPLTSLPDIYRESEQSLTDAARSACDLGIPAIMLFGVSHHKDGDGSDSLKPDGLLARMIDRAKQAAPELLVIADVCFCEYTDHGHCGPLSHAGDPDNDATIAAIGQQSVIAANAGADIIAPSGMMDGQIAAIRAALDGEGLENTPIMAYAAKYASGFYGPFREAAGCALGQDKNVMGDRKTYQMDPANVNEALREVAQDVAEGADMVMVKPGMPYLDVVARVKDQFAMPTFAYQVSGEYAMLKSAAANGWLDWDTVIMESMMAFKRAGADGILTYAAPDICKLLD